MHLKRLYPERSPSNKSCVRCGVLVCIFHARPTISTCILPCLCTSTVNMGPENENIAIYLCLLWHRLSLNEATRNRNSCFCIYEWTEKYVFAGVRTMGHHQGLAMTGLGRPHIRFRLVVQRRWWCNRIIADCLRNSNKYRTFSKQMKICFFFSLPPSQGYSSSTSHMPGVVCICCFFLLFLHNYQCWVFVVHITYAILFDGDERDGCAGAGVSSILLLLFFSFNSKEKDSDEFTKQHGVSGRKHLLW